MKTDALRAFIKKFKNGKVLVVGDLILDHYIWGGVSRISPEAPVPVVAVASETLQLGGAANVSNNIKALGGRVDLCGVVGTDEGSRQFFQVLESQGIGRDGILTDHARPTTKKTRIVAHNQQLVRFDLERCEAISGAVPVIVDPKVAHISRYKGATIITPNHLEAVQAAGLHGEDEATLLEAGRQLYQRLGCQAVLITRGERGMSLFEDRGRVAHIPTVARQVFDVTGAGDTVVATMALALAAGAPLRQAAILANYAAGVVVGMVGTAAVTAAQLEEAILHG